MAKEYKITSLRLSDLEKELNYLKTTREREIAAMIAEARSYGDLSENSGKAGWPLGPSSPCAPRCCCGRYPLPATPTRRRWRI